MVFRLDLRRSPDTMGEPSGWRRRQQLQQQQLQQRQQIKQKEMAQSAASLKPAHL